MTDWNRLKRIFAKMPLFEKTALLFLCAILIAALTHFAYTVVNFPDAQANAETYSEGMVGRIATLNPLFADFNDTDRDLTELLFSGLIKYDPVARNFLPDLAAKWERSRNGLTYVFTIRDDASWHDGTPLTAADIVFTYKGIIQHPDFRNPILKNTFEGVGIDQTGTNTVTFTLSKPNSYFISNLTTGILPKHLLSNASIARLDADAFGKAPIGSGPYKLASLKRGEDGDVIELERNETYYAAIPAIPKLRFFIFRTERELLLHKNSLRGLSKLGDSARNTLAKDPRFLFHDYSLNQFTALYYNTENPRLTDQSVRKLLAAAINKDELLTPDSVRIDTINLENKRDEADFAWDPEGAKKKLEELEYRKNEKGILIDNKGEVFQLTVLTLEKTPLHLTENLKRQWEALGIQVKIDRQEGQNFASYLAEGRYDVLLIRQNLGYNRDAYPLLHSSQIGANGLNFSRFKSFRTDGLTEAIRIESIPEDKEKLLTQLSSVLIEELPIVFISTPNYTYALDKTLTPFPQDSSLDFHSDRLTILTELEFLDTESETEFTGDGGLSAL
ncbi:hypothetical protein COV82_06590 [Candidatus Peregrinibacteria bacterium CG11_big_fil_rev_8_21_14_0_20_46_8]|nr:MAG: hypothetical protein COV82_06590 [Candidatus Peregrinibacteria bacterium CG11_big_fil_rev_8_21_14_0_20_46_8]